MSSNGIHSYESVIKYVIANSKTRCDVFITHYGAGIRIFSMVDNHRRPFEPIENEFSKLNAACARADEVVARGRRNGRGEVEGGEEFERGPDITSRK